MVGAWACIQLLLGWALLLGQSVGATEAEGPPPDLGDLPEEMEEILEESASRLLSNIGDVGDEGAPIQKFIEEAQDFFNREQSESEPLYKVTGTGEISTRKLIGNTVFLKMFLAKTNCTVEDVEENNSLRYRYFQSDEREEMKSCTLPAEYEQEKLDCDFQLFQQPRSYMSHIMAHSCKPLLLRPF